MVMWQKYKFEENKIYTLQLGKIRIYIRKLNKIWQITTYTVEIPEYSNKGFELITAQPEDIIWNNYIADKHTSLQLVPTLPDRPVVIKPEIPFTILSGMSLDIFITIPLWIQFYASAIKPENLLYEFATRELSSTWFGDPTNGELAYFLQSPIKQKLTDLEFFTDKAICPIRISNDSQTTLNFQRLSIDANQLNVYTNQNLLCTNEVKVRFKGEEQNTEVQIVQGSPDIAEGLKQVGYARSKPDKNLLKKSFYYIKSFTQY